MRLRRLVTNHLRTSPDKGVQDRIDKNAFDILHPLQNSLLHSMTILTLTENFVPLLLHRLEKATGTLLTRYQLPRHTQRQQTAAEERQSFIENHMTAIRSALSLKSLEQIRKFLISDRATGKNPFQFRRIDLNVIGQNRFKLRIKTARSEKFLLKFLPLLPVLINLSIDRFHQQRNQMLERSERNRPVLSLAEEILDHHIERMIQSIEKRFDPFLRVWRIFHIPTLQKPVGVGFRILPHFLKFICRCRTHAQIRNKGTSFRQKVLIDPRPLNLIEKTAFCRLATCVIDLLKVLQGKLVSALVTDKCQNFILRNFDIHQPEPHEIIRTSRKIAVPRGHILRLLVNRTPDLLLVSAGRINQRVKPRDKLDVVRELLKPIAVVVSRSDECDFEKRLRIKGILRDPGATDMADPVFQGYLPAVFRLQQRQLRQRMFRILLLSTHLSWIELMRIGTRITNISKKKNAVKHRFRKSRTDQQRDIGGTSTAGSSGKKAEKINRDALIVDEMTQMRLKPFLLFANRLDFLMKPIDQRDIHATHVQQQPPQRTHASGTDPSIIHRRNPRLAIFVMRPPLTKSIANQ